MIGQFDFCLNAPERWSSDEAYQALSTLSFHDWAEALRGRFEFNADAVLPKGEGPLGLLCEAMRYAVMGGGKRVRALLVYGAGALTAAPAKALDEAALAVEYVHAYSLVHDDLPCMDNDTLRRGKPTAHVRFGVAEAMLAGDSLQPEAFERLLSTGLPAAQINALTLALARASGARGMCGGQMIDLESVGERIDIDVLRQMHRLKTGALISAAVRMGALCGDPARFAALEADLGQYSAAIGLGFQVVDDILDVTASTEELGKTAGKDEAADKPTYVSLLGLEKARELAAQCEAQALGALSHMKALAEAEALGIQRLEELSHYVIRRTH